MVIIVTGAIGIGKTTVCRQVIGIVRGEGYPCGGVLTDKSPDGGIIIEDIQTGERETLASAGDVYGGPRAPKYSFSQEGIAFGLGAIADGLSSRLLLDDEFGYLELRGEGFAPVLEPITAGRVGACILVIRRGLLPAFLSRLGATPLVFETTTSNRHRLPQEIASVLLDELR